MRALIHPLITLLFITSCKDNNQNISNEMPSIYSLPISIPIDSNSRYYHKTPAIGKEMKLRNPPKVKIAGRGIKTQVSKNTQLLVKPPTIISIDEKNQLKIEYKKNVISFFVRNSGDTILTNVSIPVNGNIIKVKQPRIYKSLPPSMKDHALYTINNLDEKHGMSSSYVVSMIKDKNGNIWIGTYGQGAIRYDGNNFSFFNEESGLNGVYVYSIITDQNNNIWFGTNEGVSSYDGNTFTHYSEKEGLLNDNVRSVFEDHSGNIWFGTYGAGVTKFDGSSFIHYTEKEGLSDNIVRCITEDEKNNIWIGTQSHGITMFDGKSFYHLIENALNNNPVRYITEDSKNNIWIGTQAYGVIKYDGKSFSSYSEKQGLNNNAVSAIFESQLGKLWFGTESGLTYFDGSMFTYYSEKQGLSNNSVEFIGEDNIDQYWVGTFGGGLIKLDLQGFSYFNTNSLRGQNNILIWAITEDKNGNIWFGTNGEGIIGYDENDFTQYTTNEGLSDNTVYSILEDKTGNIWLGTNNGGVNKFDLSSIKANGKTLPNGKASFTHFTVNQGLNDNLTWFIHEDINGNFWFGTDHSGVTRYNGSSFTHFTEMEGLSNNNCYSILEDQAGNLWFGTYGGGVTIYDGSSFSYFTQKEGLGNDNVNSILQDRKGRIWIGTDGGGITCIANGSFISFTVKEGLSNNSIFSVKEDHKGNIWVGTGKGLNLIHEIHCLDSNSDENNLCFKIYNWKNELKGEDFAQNSVLIDKNNVAWWGTSKGILKLDLNNFKIPDHTPTVFLRQVDINSEPHDYRFQTDSQKIGIKYDSVASFDNYPISPELKYNKNHLTFYFSSMDWESPHRIKYSYTLEGYENNWSELQSDDKVDYRNLFPGKYRFKVRAIGISQKWSEPFEYKFTILPPWWRTWWAYLFYILSFCGLILGIISYRSAALKRENRVLEHKVSHRTIQLEKKSTELERSLKDLKSTQSQLIQSEKMASLGELTAGIAHEIQNPLNFVNNFAEINKELISEMKVEIKHGNLKQINSLAEIIEENEEKINLHGRRVENIVKSMLQHNRNVHESTGVKELININALIKEYIRLSYNAIKAKDKSFIADFRTDLDESIPNIMAVPQDIGRLLLNLINNAYYAVNEKLKEGTAILSENPDIEMPILNKKNNYKPMIKVSTKLLLDNSLEIRVEDNGNGIPQNTINKIFQPFFTTKPTGQGMGLGLSLAYDIVTKGHGGTIDVNSKEGEGTEFIVRLSVT